MQSLKVCEYLIQCCITTHSGYCTFLIGVSVPLGVKSTSWTPRLSVVVENTRSDVLQWYWINYQGLPVCYAIIQPRTSIRQLTYGTHPWLITDAQQRNIALFIPYAANTRIIVEYVKHSHIIIWYIHSIPSFPLIVLLHLGDSVPESQERTRLTMPEQKISLLL